MNDVFTSKSISVTTTIYIDKSSAVAEMGDRLATIDMGRKARDCCALFHGGWVPRYLTQVAR